MYLLYILVVCTSSEYQLYVLVVVLVVCGSCFYMLYVLGLVIFTSCRLYLHEKYKIPFSSMLYAYSVKRAYRGTKPKESFR